MLSEPATIHLQHRILFIALRCRINVTSFEDTVETGDTVIVFKNHKGSENSAGGGGLGRGSNASTGSTFFGEFSNLNSNMDLGLDGSASTRLGGQSPRPSDSSTIISSTWRQLAFDESEQEQSQHVDIDGQLAVHQEPLHSLGGFKPKVNAWCKLGNHDYAYFVCL